MTLLRPSVLPLAAVCCTLAACGGSAKTVATRASSTPITSVATRATTAAPRPVRPAGPPPGSLPQTNQLPSSDTPQFRQLMAALWSGVRSGSVGAAEPAFFPEMAYAQVKAIADPAADFRNRLLSEFGLDLQAAHALLGSAAAGARLLAVRVPESYAHWVPPGGCFNRVGYYEVPNSRVVYSLDGAVHSFGIASLISWRGVWYVVHLGAVVRPGTGGVVDDPETGPGFSTPSSTC